MYLFSRMALRRHSSNGLRIRPEQALSEPNDEALARDLARKIVTSPLQIVAIDFDRTLIDEDSGSSMSFRNIYIRNQFFWLIPHLIGRKWICIASFNENTPTPFNEHLGIVTQTIVRRLLKLSDKHLSRDSIHNRLALDYKIIIEAYPGRSYGKLEHLKNCINKIQKISSLPIDIQPFHIALFDDHPMNIMAAKENFPSVLLSISEFNKNHRTMEPIAPLIHQLVERSWQEHDEKKRKYSRGDR